MADEAQAGSGFRYDVGNPRGVSLTNFSSTTSDCPVEPGLRQGHQFADLWIQPLIGLGLAALVIGFLFRSTISSMVSIWYGSSTYSYGLVVVPVCAFLVWRRRAQLSGLQPTASYAGVALFLLCAMMWLAGNIADAQVVQQVAFIGMIEALIWAFLGAQIIRVIAFALLFLFFAVPAGESLVEPLQRLTAAFTVNAVRLSGIPAVQDGFVLSTPSGDWKVAEACSGIRYLTSSVVVGVLVAGVVFRSWRRRIAFVLISALVPILANALRAYLIVVLAYLSNNRIAAGVDHIIYGWIFFSLVTATLIALALRWREPEVPPADLASSSLVAPSESTWNTHLIWCMGGIILIAIFTTLVADFLWSRVPPNQPMATIWSAPSNWLAAADPDPDWAPSFENIESEAFTKDSREVSLYIASYPMKRRGVELVNSLNAVGTSGQWKLLNTGFREARISAKPVTVAEYLIASGGQHRLVWMWYLSGDELTAKPYRIKLMQAQSRLVGRPANVFLFAISTAVNQEPAEALRNLREFAESMSFPNLTGSPDERLPHLP
jgi:exosortase A